MRPPRIRLGNRGPPSLDVRSERFIASRTEPLPAPKPVGVPQPCSSQCRAQGKERPKHPIEARRREEILFR